MLALEIETERTENPEKESEVALNYIPKPPTYLYHRPISAEMSC